VELSARIRDLLVGPGAAQLVAIEDVTKRRFFLDAKEDVALDHFVVVAKGPLEKVAPETGLDEGSEVELKLVEIGLYDAQAGVGKLDGLDVAVAGAAKLVGKKVKVRIERVVDGTAYATLVAAVATTRQPISAEDMAEKPTRATRSRSRVKPEASGEPAAEPEAEAEAELEAGVETEAYSVDAVAAGEELPKKRKRRRGTRGGRNRRKTPAVTAEGAAGGDEILAPDAGAEVNGPVEEPAARTAIPRIHVPSSDLGGAKPVAEAAEDGATADGDAEAAPKKKRTRRGSRGGRGRKKKPAAAAAEATATQAGPDQAPTG
jgi:predicted RNA-binding protein with TRAM domain